MARAVEDLVVVGDLEEPPEARVGGELRLLGGVLAARVPVQGCGAPVLGLGKGLQRAERAHPQVDHREVAVRRELRADGAALRAGPVWVEEVVERLAQPLGIRSAVISDLDQRLR